MWKGSGRAARCPACADTTKGISGRRAHNDECRDRIGKFLMDEGAQRVESHFERARVREETGLGGTATSSGSATVVTHAQTPKRKADDETVETVGGHTRAAGACRRILRFRRPWTQGQPHADRALSRGTTRSTARHKELRRRHGDQSIENGKRGQKSARSES